MRLVDLLLLASIFAAAVISVIYFRRPWPLWLLCLILIAGAVLVASQILWEGWRWQMLPAYVAIIPVIFLSSATNPFARSLSIANLLVSVFVGTALGYVFPVFRLPTPRGPYQVGTFVRHLIDRSRRERHASSPQAPRELMIQVWYPARNVAGILAWYRDPRLNTAKAYHFRLIKNHFFLNSPPAEQPPRFPVVLFLPSSRGVPSPH